MDRDAGQRDDREDGGGRGTPWAPALALLLANLAAALIYLQVDGPRLSLLDPLMLWAIGASIASFKLVARMVGVDPELPVGGTHHFHLLKPMRAVSALCFLAGLVWAFWPQPA